MSVTLAAMESAYSLRLGLSSHPHLFQHLHHPQRSTPIVNQQNPSINNPLRFSVVNILRPEFGRDAIISKSASRKKSVSPQLHSPSLPRDLSLSRLPSPAVRDTESFSGTTSPVQRHSTLSRSGSLESLASNRSSLNGSLTGTPSLSSGASTIGESVSGDSVGGSTNTTSGSNGQSLWPAWVYCTRYSDRPSSGKRSHCGFIVIIKRSDDA